MRLAVARWLALVLACGLAAPAAGATPHGAVLLALGLAGLAVIGRRPRPQAPASGARDAC